LELASGGDDDDVAVLAGQVDAAVGLDWRRTETAADWFQALAVDLLARLQIVCVEDTAVAQYVKDAVVRKRCRHVGSAAGLAPCNHRAAVLVFWQRDVAMRA